MTANDSTQHNGTEQSGEGPTRRRLLVSVGGASLVAVAGCLGGGDENDGDDNGTDSNGAAATGDDSTGGGNGETDNGTDTTGNGTDSSTDDGTDDSTDDGTDSDDDSDSTDDGDENGTDDSTDTVLADVYQWTNSYVMEFTGPDTTGTGVFHEGDIHMTGTFEGEETEFYLVDGDAYTVTDGECFSIPNLNPDQYIPADTPEPDNYGDLTPSGTRMHDGQEVYVYDVAEGEYLISVATGYPVQYSTGTGIVVEFHSWGETDPISAPDMQCQSF